jgi:predicted RNA binding protein YcfA (HicA-like mRNA interferase family)
MSNTPAISGNDLIKLLVKHGWTIHGKRTHGAALKKIVDGKTLVTIIPTKNDSLPKGTLSAILGIQQTNIGTDGLLEMLKKKKK